MRGKRGYLAVSAFLVVVSFLLRGTPWLSSASFHTRLEIIATFLAIVVGVLALVRYYTKKSNALFFVGTGFLGTGLLDGYHAIVTSDFFAPYLPSELPSLIPWSWISSRVFLSLLLWLSWLAWQGELRLAKPGRFRERTTYLAIGALALANFAFFGFVPLPRAYYPEIFLHRPAELVPALFFLLASLGYSREGSRGQDPFERWLILSLFVGFVSQAVFMSFSSQLFDAMFDAAHLLKIVSYGCVFVSLATNMSYLFTQAEAADAKYKGLFEQSLHPIYITSTGGEFLDVNQAMLDLFGYTREEMRAANARALYVDPADRQDLKHAVAERGHVREFPLCARRKDGKAIDTLVTTVARHDLDGEIIGYQGIIRDVTDKKRLKQQLERSERRLTNVIGTAADAIISIDEDQRIALFNMGAERIFGHSALEVLGQPLAILLPEASIERHREHIAVFADEAETARAMGTREPIKGRRKDGSEFAAEAGISKTSEDGKMTFTVVLRDVTERLRLEKQLRASQRMDAIGQLAGGVAHDFNNLLMGMTGFADLARRQLDPEHPVQADLQQIVEVGSRAAILTRQLLTFSRRQAVEPIVLDLNAVVRDVEKLLGRLIREDIDLITELQTGLGNVKLDPGHAEQIVVNLVVNAADASPNGGHVTIVTSEVAFAHPSERQGVVIAPGTYARLAVTDAGVGMDQETQDHVFEPFFTTKGRDKGTGMGLATVYGIVKQSGGYIFVDSELGQGTTFDVYIPEVEEAAEARRPSQLVAEVQGGSETILVVDDDQGVCTVVERVLRHLGYIVLTATDPVAALQILDEYDGPLELLLSDVVMPGMSGPELARRLTSLRAGMNVLFMSGYLDLALHERPEGIALIGKPFTSDELGRKVREVLDSPGDDSSAPER